MVAWGIVPETETRPSPNSWDKYKAEGRNELGFTPEFHFSRVFFENKDRFLPTAFSHFMYRAFWGETTALLAALWPWANCLPSLGFTFLLY